MKQQLILKQKQELRQRLSPQQIRAVEMLELSAMEFEQRIKDELAENPALEDLPPESADAPINIDDIEELPHYGKNISERTSTLSVADLAHSRGVSLHETILQQIATLRLSEREKKLCVYLAGCIDDNGYLCRSSAEIADDILFSDNIETTESGIEETLKIIQRLEPAGVGARNLRECLLLQLRRRDTSDADISLAVQIVTDMFDDFSHKRYDKIMEKMGLDEARLKKAMQEITRLNPKPGSIFDNEDSNFSPAIFPDFIVENRGGELTQMLVTRHQPILRINSGYERLSLGANDANSSARLFAQQKVGDAQWFIQAVQQRANTLTAIMTAIVKRQRKFFITGDESDLRPLTQQVAAQDAGCDVSTVSRVVSNKYVQTNFGVLPLKYFFVAATHNVKDEHATTAQIKNLIASIIDGEDRKHPMQDGDIVATLRQHGFEIARRTAAKYRDELNIPVWRLRREI